MRSTERTWRRRIGCDVHVERLASARRPIGHSPPPGAPTRSRRRSGAGTAGAPRPACSNSSRSTRAVASSTSAATLGAANAAPGELGVLERGELVAVKRATPSPASSSLLAARPRARRRARRACAPRSRRRAARRRAPAGSAPQNTSWRRASSTATTTRLVWRSGYATRSRLGIADHRDAQRLRHHLGGGDADPQAGEQPGPDARPRSRRGGRASTPARAHRYSIAGASCSAWRRPAGRAAPSPEHARRRRRARPTTCGGRGVDREEQHHVSLPAATATRARRAASAHDAPAAVER